jgi:hypothetical protein
MAACNFQDDLQRRLEEMRQVSGEHKCNFSLWCALLAGDEKVYLLVH